LGAITSRASYNLLLPRPFPGKLSFVAPIYNEEETVALLRAALESFMTEAPCTTEVVLVSFLRGMTAWVGYPQIAVPYTRAARAAGETKYPMRKMLSFAWTAATSFSTVPLRLSFATAFVAALLFSAGILGEYVGKIYEQGKHRPLYLAARTFNLGDETLPDEPRGRAFVSFDEQQTHRSERAAL